MEHLQAELDAIVRREYDNRHTVFGTPGVYYKRCLWTLRQLSVTYRILPASLVIRDVKQEGRHAVGGGGFADIYRGTILNLGRVQLVCLKVLRLVMEQDEETRDKIRKEFCKEALIWRQLKHPNILPLLGVNAELFSPSFCLISPWMENRDIITYLKNNPGHNRHTVLSEIAAGLYYLHSRDPPILHGDIRGANILVTDDLHCCLADFGLALIISDSRTLSTTSAMTKGTTRWMAPELIIPNNSARQAPNHTSRDVYAFGCTVLEILTLRLPFHDKTRDPAVIYSLMTGERPARPQNIWYPDAIWDLTTRCWTQEAAARPSAQEIYDFLQTTLTTSTTSHKNNEQTVPLLAAQPYVATHTRQNSGLSWVKSSWQLDPNLMPTPPPLKESLIFRDCGFPEFFGPRSPLHLRESLTGGIPGLFGPRSPLTQPNSSRQS
ncbi:kinase-like protein [Gymnopus androsaceus JB14]|uniref:Kinase-like protein n=1 Tax=Gymnopus androsaceus JB14 TaxID=1447944 RepID=A0A6A4HX97_9AGAR|nr:kinase-like protein [Gymnopus androsaceus JB14]